MMPRIVLLDLRLISISPTLFAASINPSTLIPHHFFFGLVYVADILSILFTSFRSVSGDGFALMKSVLDA